jgi:hypothetical protein
LVSDHDIPRPTAKTPKHFRAIATRNKPEGLQRIAGQRAITLSTSQTRAGN